MSYNTHVLTNFSLKCVTSEEVTLSKEKPNTVLFEVLILILHSFHINPIHALIVTLWYQIWIWSTSLPCYHHFSSRNKMWYLFVPVGCIPPPCHQAIIQTSSCHLLHAPLGQEWSSVQKGKYAIYKEIFFKKTLQFFFYIVSWEPKGRYHY